ncbi:MAG TPA: signal peptide peptidase SppA, partial [Cryomorphaceae bacterium]|nr:signal peptide peptidase SppA [Cryomorphaceae bacterium]
MNELVKTLEHAAQDDRIQGILLEQGLFAAGYGMLEELTDYLKEFKAATGKPIYSYGEYYTQKGAALSTIADSTILHPGGIFELSGVGTSSTYYKDFFDKFGIEPLVVRGTGNKFKSAVEPYIASEMSDENRLQLTNLISQFWDFIGDQFESKGIDRAALDRAATNFIGMDADACLDAGLVDALGYKEDVMNHFEDRYSLLQYSDYAAQIPPVEAKDRIAIIYANGSIGSGSGDESTIGTENIVKALRKADKNKRVKAIVLRVNSPGGSALTSDIIHHTIGDIEKPLIVSQANYAASGGYYISCNADAIFTNSTTITGSIGIFMSLFTAEELMTETLGLKVEEVQTHPMANFPNLAKHPDEAQYAILQRMIDRGYADFTGKVAEGRSMDMDYL